VNTGTQTKACPARTPRPGELLPNSWALFAEKGPDPLGHRTAARVTRPYPICVTAEDWQAIFEAIAALGTLLAGAVSLMALHYFKGQRDQMKRQNDRIEEESIMAAWPRLSFESAPVDPKRAPTTVTLGLRADGGGPIGYLEPELRVGDVECTCDPPIITVLRPGDSRDVHVQYGRLSGPTRGTLTIVFRDANRHEVEWKQDVLCSAVDGLMVLPGVSLRRRVAIRTGPAAEGHP
jgi:hypothetical protein